MPHVNILWPFVAGHLESIKSAITNDARFKKISPFKVRLSAFCFKKGSKYLTLAVETFPIDHVDETILYKPSVMNNMNDDENEAEKVETVPTTSDNKNNTISQNNKSKKPIAANTKSKKKEKVAIVSPLLGLHSSLKSLFPLCCNAV
jgi:hypothetical protein